LRQIYKPEGELPQKRIEHRPFGLWEIMQGRNFDQLTAAEKLLLINHQDPEVREWARNHRVG
jgi:hypothetical protein